MSAGARRTALIAAGGALALAGFGAYAWHISQRAPILELFVWDTPGYPTILIRTPNDRRILVNGGSNADVIRRLTSVLPFYSRRIDLVIATNGDAKALTGLVEAANRYDIGGAIVQADAQAATSSDPALIAFMRTLDEKRVRYEPAQAGKRVVLDDRVAMEILSADRDMVMRVAYERASFLLAGKAPLKAQNEAVARMASSTAPAAAARVDALVVAANPLSSNLSKKLVAAARPRYLVYSASMLKTAAPTKDKAGFLAGILEQERFNTKKTGGVRIFSDGGSVRAEGI